MRLSQQNPSASNLATLRPSSARSDHWLGTRAGTGHAFPRLIDAHLAPLRRAGRRGRTSPDQLVLRGGGPDYDFFVVLEGTVAVLEQEPGDKATPRVIAVHGPGRFLGGLNMLAGHRPVRSVVVQEPGAGLTLPVDRLRTVLARDAALANVVTRSFLLRRAMSGAGVLTPALTPGTGPGPGWVDFPFGMTPEVLLLELRGAAAVFTQRIR